MDKQEKTIKILKQYQKLNVDEKILSRALEEWEKRKARMLKIAKEEKEPVAQDVADSIDELFVIPLRVRTKDKLEKCVKILKAIDQIEDKEEKDVLSCLYINGWSIEETAKYMLCTCEFVEEIHKKAVSSSTLQNNLLID